MRGLWPGQDSAFHPPTIPGSARPERRSSHRAQPAPWEEDAVDAARVDQAAHSLQIGGIPLMPRSHHEAISFCAGGQIANGAAWD